MYLRWRLCVWHAVYHSFFFIRLTLLFLANVVQHVSSVLLYDRQTSLKIGSSTKVSVQFGKDSRGSLPPYLEAVPLRWHPLPPPPDMQKRRRRRGTRERRLVKLRIRISYLPHDLRSVRQSFPRLLVPSRALDPVDSWLVPVVGSIGSSPVKSFPRWRRMDRSDLRPVDLVVTAAEVSKPAPLRLALINARSVVNKTFILKDFCSSHALDFLCLTETWSSPGELSAFSELLPAGCAYFSALRASGGGGGLAVVFKSHFEFKQLSSWTRHSSFELCLCELGHSPSLLCAIVYRPPFFGVSR